MRAFVGHQGDVDAVAWQPNGNLVATGSADRSARLWDVRSSKCVRLMPGHTHGVSAVAISPDGSTLVAGETEGGLRVWDLGSAESLSELPAHTGTVHSLAVSRAGQLIASGGADCCLALWQPAQYVPRAALSVPWLFKAGLTCKLALDLAGHMHAICRKHATKAFSADAFQGHPAVQSSGPVAYSPLASYLTRSTPVCFLRFTRSNLLLAGGPRLPAESGHTGAP